jgi:hypothetical protein
VGEINLFLVLFDRVGIDESGWWGSHVVNGGSCWRLFAVAELKHRNSSNRFELLTRPIYADLL